MIYFCPSDETRDSKGSTLYSLIDRKNSGIIQVEKIAFSNSSKDQRVVQITLNNGLSMNYAG